MLQYDKVRQYPRAPLKVLVKEKSGKGSPFYYSRDICEGGIFLITRQPLPLGTKLHLMFALPEDTMVINATGETVSALTGAELHGMGVKFIEIGESERKIIARYVLSVLSKDTRGIQMTSTASKISAGSRSLRLEIAVPSEVAYNAFCDLDKSEWWRGAVDDISVVERTQTGRIKTIKCHTSLIIPRKSFSLDFLYNEKEKRVFWHSCGGDFTEIRGHAGFDDAGEKKCVMHFFIMVNTGMVIPAKIEENIADSVLPKSLDKFKIFIEKTHL